MKILIIEDDTDTVEILRLTLEVYDPVAEIISSQKGYEGLEYTRSTQPDLVLLDLGLPDIDGMEVLKELRRFSKTPVLVISARHDPEVITGALAQGAEDYILKPFSLQTLMKRLKEYSDRDINLNQQEDRSRITNDLTICRINRKVALKGTEIELTGDEWKVLDSMLEHRGRIITIRKLIKILNKEEETGESLVRQVVDQLIRKLGDNPDFPRIIVSEYDCGYRFNRTITAA